MNKNPSRYARQFYSKPHYAALSDHPIFAVKPLHVTTRSRARVHYSSGVPRRTLDSTLPDSHNVTGEEKH